MAHASSRALNSIRDGTPHQRSMRGSKGRVLPVAITLELIRIPIEDVCHGCFKPETPGQVRGVSWFAPVLLRLVDLRRARMMRQIDAPESRGDC